MFLQIMAYGMHACQIGLTDTALLARDGLTGPASDKGEHFGAGQLSAPISLLLFLQWNYTFPLGFTAVVLSVAI